MSEVKFFKCMHCGNIAGLIHNSGVPMVCCGDKMTELIPNTTDAAQEKHVPVVKVDGSSVTVTVGSTLHPMEEKHYIQWIALAAGDRLMIKYLKPGEAPETTFCEVPSGTIYEYCNLHGLWKADF